MNPLGPPGPSHTDLQLLEAWRSGHAAAGVCLFERHYDSVARFFSTKVGEDHEDLIQGTFLDCLELIEGSRAHESFKILLFAIARNKLLEYVHARGFEARYLSPMSGQLRRSASSWTSLLTERAQQRRLLRGLHALPLDTQLMLELFYWEGMAVKEIAAVVELPLNTVKTRMRRGRLKLAEQLGTPGPATGEASSAGPEQLREGFDRWARDIRRAREGAAC